MGGSARWWRDTSPGSDKFAHTPEIFGVSLCNVDHNVSDQLSVIFIGEFALVWVLNIFGCNQGPRTACGSQASIVGHYIWPTPK